MDLSSWEQSFSTITMFDFLEVMVYQSCQFSWYIKHELHLYTESRDTLPGYELIPRLFILLRLQQNHFYMWSELYYARLMWVMDPDNISYL